MFHLLRRGEECGADAARDDLSQRGAERAEVLGQSPAVNRDARDRRAAMFQALDQLGDRFAKLLNGDPQADDRTSLVEQGERLAPGIWLGDPEVDPGAQLAEGRRR